VNAKPFDVFSPHKVDHVFATWYPENRRSRTLIVIDVSGSMGQAPPGTTKPLIELVREGCRSIAKLLPDDAELGIWEFGTNLDPPRDYRPVVPTAPLADAERGALDKAIGALAARQTNTGLYDTILGAYQAARDGFRSDLPNQVLVFTDGIQDDPGGGLSAAQLSAQLAQSMDPKRPVQLSVALFGQTAAAAPLKDILKPIGGYVDPISTPAQIAAVFIHVAAGGLHG
jgi:Ca-activated chloride channel homolog